MCLFFSAWTELAVCRHKTISLYMADDHLVHSANHMYHLLCIYIYIYINPCTLPAQCLYALHMMLTLKCNYFSIQC
jgi:hypothetical protein